MPALPFDVHGNLEEPAKKEENPDADDAEEARLERVVALVAVLEARRRAGISNEPFLLP